MSVIEVPSFAAAPSEPPWPPACSIAFCPSSPSCASAGRWLIAPQSHPAAKIATTPPIRAVRVPMIVFFMVVLLVIVVFRSVVSDRTRSQRRVVPVRTSAARELLSNRPLAPDGGHAPAPDDGV